jgi:hypothetical protein
MTSREEIERLLNQTGRTLEGLPEEYDIEFVSDVSDEYPGWFLKSNFILYQSDVIELLVGALRDALEDRTEEISDAKFEEFSKKAREAMMRRNS